MRKWSLRSALLQCPLEELLGVVQDCVTLAAEGDDDNGFSIEDAGGNETAPGGGGVAGLHAGAVGKALENLVGVGEGFGAAIGVLESVLLGSHTLTVEGDFGDLACENGDIECGGILSFFSQSVGVFEVRLCHAKRTGGLVHVVDEGGFGAGDVAGENFGNVISRSDEEGFDESLAGVAFAGANVDF